MNNLINIGGHGLGDCLLSLQISHLLSQQNIEHINLISTRQEIYNVLQFLYSNLQKIDESITNNNNIEHNQDIYNNISKEYKSNNITYNVPDLLFRNKLSIDVDKYNINYSLIKKTRTLLNKKKSSKKIIYFGLCSNTEGYLYKDIPLLLKLVASKLPDYTIYFPKLTHWVKDISYNGDFSNIPSNVWIHENPDFIESIDILTQSCYGVFTCNGPSHIAYHLGIPRLVLDPQFFRIPWMSRWKEDNEECINIQEDPSLISLIIYHNITTPQTTMIDRKILASAIAQGYNNWNELFFFKY